MNCPKCGVEINPEQVLCVKCGHQIREINKKKGSNVGCIIGAVVGFFVLVFFSGIFAAIAYPQYAKAVEKAKATQAIMTIQLLADAETRHYLSNNNYTADLSKLDIEVPDAKVNGNTADTDAFVYEVNLPYIKASRKNNHRFNYAFNYNIQTDEFKCEGSELFCQYFQ